jgi:hypothetical protein
MAHLAAAGINCPRPVETLTCGKMAAISQEAVRHTSSGDIVVTSRRAFESLSTRGGGAIELAVRLLTWVHGSTLRRGFFSSLII